MSEVFERLKAIFARPNDDPQKIVAVAVALCLVCATIVSAAAVSLRPLQEHNASLALKGEILKVADLYDPAADIEQAFARLDARLVDLATGEYVRNMDVTAYDWRKAAEDPKIGLALSAEEDTARIRKRAKFMPVYLHHEDDALQSLILPVHGYGLWSTMYGLIALAPDGRTLQAVSFYDQRETAGLGGEVANPRWQATWVGKQVADADGAPRFAVAKGSVDANSPDAVYQVDGLSGATLTSNGVTNLVRFWVGEMGFGPYLARVRQGNWE
jgi:Na+-transporting NADH:ubiquinone oxidoreductase subunit C